MIQKRCIICKTNFLCYNPPYEKRDNRMIYNRGLKIYGRRHDAVTCSRECSKKYARFIPEIKNKIRLQYQKKWQIKN